ncbi:MAG: glycosyltransferase family 4 protein, partial [Nitrososphaerales archaeon]
MKILFLVTEDWYFFSHRLSMARAARSDGAEVYVMSRITKLRAALEQEGFRVIDWHVSRGSWNPILELRSFSEVVGAYRHVRPDLLHHIALKGILHGGVAARICGGIPSINAVAGLGYLFSSSTRKAALLRGAFSRVMKWVMGGGDSVALFQNEENRDTLTAANIVRKERSVIIRGVGVDIEKFSSKLEPGGVPIVLLPSRMLWDKGVAEFVSAARLLKQDGVTARFVLVGRLDLDNPAAIADSQLRKWVNTGIVEWWGHRDDMAVVFAEAHLVCLPSYLEGLPKVLLEAAACGRAIVTTDVPGCRDVVKHGSNGLLVPPKDANSLA